MKKLTFIILASLSIPSFAADTIALNRGFNPDNIRINSDKTSGINAGNLEDVIANYPGAAAAIRSAIRTHVLANPLPTRSKAQAFIARAEAVGVTLTTLQKNNLLNNAEDQAQ